MSIFPQRLFSRKTSPWDNQEPVREELFSVERLEDHARSLAAAQPVTPKPAKGRPLAGRLAANGAILLAAYKSLLQGADEGRAVTPAAEWLIDNYHLIEKQIREIRSDLPAGYYRQLPKLAVGPFAGYPRVFGLAWAFVAHTDSRFDSALLVRYVRAYQEVQPLTIGELWAVSITLRIVMIENLRRLAEQIVTGRAARHQADDLADRLLGAAGQKAEPLKVALADQQDDVLSEAFAVQLIHRLRDQDPTITPALTWLDQRLAAQSTTADIVVREIHRRQGAASVTVRNIITSVRLISDVDWKDLFEDVSLVDEALAADGGYKDMDFPSRNLYRTAIEELARGASGSEQDIAHGAVAAARRFHNAAPALHDARKADSGYHLIGGGRAEFENTIGYRPRARKWRARLHRVSGIGFYVGAIGMVAACLLGAALAATGLGALPLVVLAVLGAVPAIDAAVALINRAVGFGFHAHLLPALELANGVPSHLRTLVAVPTLLTNPASIEEQIEGLEIHHLASPDGDLHFALLSDWLDAATEHVEGDDELLATAVEGVARLNRTYGPAPGGPRFLLLHRRRVWSPSESRWIGWERKRGKLHELNRFLRGASDAGFIPLDGAAPLAPPDTRYVVTLDADTRLPRDAVRRLIGKMAHPLNRPRFDAITRRIVEGYGVLQPRVTPSLPVGREGSLFQRIFSSVSGIDPYASAVSDVYQDMFGEGSYAGKGVYDIDAFEAALDGRAPDSTLLSHDLFEGVFARAGLASDIEVVESYPPRYDVGALRHHRWARGDWQLLPWIFGRGPGHQNSSNASTALPAVGRWKMLDNLRRTLSAPFAVLALLVGWLMPFDAALVWTGFVLATIALPPMIPVIAAMPPRKPGVTLASHFRAVGRDLKLALVLSALTLIFLGHQAWLMGDAIVRTLYRLYVSHRNLLEWVPAAQATGARRLDLPASYRRMFGALVFAALAVAFGWIGGPGNLALAGVFAALWLASPAVARWVSLPPRRASRAPLSGDDAQALRLTARRTWRFFETFVAAGDNMLPPDNFQETPTPRVAHRTSPTNIGLYLLSLASAHDFGWLGTRQMVDGLEATLATMSGMARYRGHFYNWYDTTDLRPLDPKYVSTVDSGNLAGHLIALANACREWQGAQPDAASRLAGIADALDLTREEAGRLRDGRKTQTVTWRQLDDALTALAAATRDPLTTPDALGPRLEKLGAQADTMADIARALAAERDDEISADMLFWAQASVTAIAAHRDDFLTRDMGETHALRLRLERLEDLARSMALAMDFAFLMDRQRNLLSIGCLAPEGALDSNCYDLLASEARLASFFAIAKGDIPARHWFHLGRAAIPVAQGAALISWSGSMFEYLMPSLVMRAPAGSLLDGTNRLVVGRQIAFADKQHLPSGAPWGVSESAYNARDLELTYQYSNFGIPGLGLKRGLADNFVVAPYATGLATMIDPHAARANLDRLAGIGARGRYGYYEAIDYTPTRVPDGQDRAIVRAFMAHHQGMTIIAIGNAVLGARMRARFHAEPMVQATELLLQERAPRDVAVSHPWAAETKSPAKKGRDVEPLGGRAFSSAQQASPATHLLSNGLYSTMLTTAGSGYSRWDQRAVTRWREDAVCDDFGSYVFLRDVHSDEVWSAGFQPSGREPDDYRVAFNEDRAEFVRQDGMLTTSLDVLVSSEDDAEVRRVSVTNNGPRVREIEITSYSELALAAQASDVAHPAFSKLFVETEFLPEVGALLATRRRREPNEAEIWVGQLAVVDGETIGKIEVETDRARFLGRGKSVRTPLAMIDGRALSNTVGAVLDPIFALRRRVRVAPGAVARISFWTMAASTRETLLDIVDKHRDATAYTRATTLAWTQAQVQLHHLGITAGEASLFQRLASHVLYANQTMRPPSDAIIRGAGTQSGLWALGVSGDLPIVLLRIADSDDLDVARELLQAHEYWRMKQLAVDLVILNERQSSYVQDLQIALETLLRTRQMRPRLRGEESPGGVFVLRGDLIPAETSALLASVARVVIVAQRGGLFAQLDRIVEPPPPLRATASSHAKRPGAADLEPAKAPVETLEFFNGLGGFDKDGQEYVTVLGPGQATPAPWINVIANESFGFQAAAEGSGYTWSVNSRENQLTPWSNDPVADRPGEAFYLRDDDTGDLWNPTALPIRLEAATYIARHGRGYSRFEHTSHGIESDLLQFVPLDASIKISRLTLRNLSGRIRHLSVTAFVEWALGPSRTAGLPFVTTALDSQSGAIFARNRWNAGLGGRVAFADLGGRQTDWTGDRREFIGRNGTLGNPAAPAGGAALSNSLGAALDPCAAMRSGLVLAPGASVEISFLLGDAPDSREARHLIGLYRNANLDEAFAKVGRHWDGILDAVTVKTPDRSMDIMLNGWLLYQTIACRLWARAAFYQASGAYGFRDQLQDGMALSAVRPQMTRAHVLRAAARQFVEGDVQHWWLPHSGQGVRTRISDDRAWLAFTVGQYVEASGDAAVLDERIPFLAGRVLEPSEHDSFFTPSVSEDTATLFEHCARALDSSLAQGGHGLPLIGAGDWNDGLNRVGARGAGESVWLGWLLYAALKNFGLLADARGEHARAENWRTHANALQASVEREAWDGEWYRRGFFDDGTPLGSSQSEECRIDCIAQSWAALSGAAPQERATRAMASVERELIRPQDGLAPLFAPPFDKTPLDPGYIKGYPPGVRENGGQYTHAALWSVMAFAKLGQGDKAANLFAMLNPINHARTRADVHRYKVEPYVVAADVYSMPPHVGRGGWTWYTGSAAWMQRAGLESILGMRLEGDCLCVHPCIPKAWAGFELTLRHGSSRYEIRVENPAGVERGVIFAAIDGAEITARPPRLPLVDDGAAHRVVIRLG